MTSDSADIAASRIDLGREPAFVLDGVSVTPALCEVTVAGRVERLQPRVMQVLVALAQARGALVSRDSLIERCWGGLAIGDDAINRCIQRLRRLAETAGPGGFVIDTVPRVGYRLLTRPPEDAVASTPAGAASPITAAATGRPAWIAAIRRQAARAPLRWGLGAIGVFALLIAVAVFILSVRPATANVVAIAPLQTASGDPQTQELATAIGNQIQSTLNLNSMRTLSPDAARGLSGPNRAEAARALKVRFILGGVVDKGDQTLRVNLHLDDALTQTTLWTLAFERPADKARAFPIQVAGLTAKVLFCALHAGKAKAAATDGDTMALLLQACAAGRTSNDLAEIRRRFDAVTARAPRLAVAYSQEAMAGVILAPLLPEAQAEAARTEAKREARKAISIDKTDGTAYVALAQLTPERNWAERDALYKQGLAADPDNADLNMNYSGFERTVGRFDDGLRLAQHGWSLKPPGDMTDANLAKLMADKGLWSQAKARIDHAAEIWPDSGQVRQDRFRIAVFGGDLDHAQALLDDPATRQASAEPAQIAAWTAVIKALRSHAPADQKAARDLVMHVVDLGQFEATLALRVLGDIGMLDDAFALARRPRVWPGYLFAPDMAAMRRDPRFMPLMDQWGLVDYWRASGQWPDFCQAADRPYDCKAEAAKAVAKR